MINAAAVLMCFPSPNGFLETGDTGNIIGGGDGTASCELSKAAGAAAGDDDEDIVRTE
jgi:hypothetical protein